MADRQQGWVIKWTEIIRGGTKCLQVDPISLRNEICKGPEAVRQLI